MLHRKKIEKGQKSDFNTTTDQALVKQKELVVDDEEENFMISSREVNTVNEEREITNHLG